MGKKIVTMEDAIESKKASIKKINKLLDKFIPSNKGKVYDRDIFLQDDLFKQINRKGKTLLKTANDSYDKLMKLINLLDSTSEGNSFPEVAITDEVCEDPVYYGVFYVVQSLNFNNELQLFTFHFLNLAP